MRLIQLNVSGDEAQALDLHPMMTVVPATSPAGRDAIVRAVSALPRGTDPGCSGLLEAHGILLDLSPENLRLLDLSSEIDVVVRGDDLPGKSSPTGHGVGEVTGAPAPLSPERFLDTTPHGVHDGLDRARAGQADAREALAILKEAFEAARRGHQEALERRYRIEADMADLVGRRNRSGLRLVTDEFVPDDGISAEHVSGLRAELEARLAELEATVERSERGLAELSSLDVRPIEVLLDAVHNPGPVEYVPSERAHELAGEFERLQAGLTALEDELAAQGFDYRAALSRFEVAQVELAEAEKSLRPPEYTDDDRVELEAAHDEVIEAEKKARGRGGKKRLDEAVERERAILARMGFPTWSAYVMGAALWGADPLAEQRVERARFELESAERDWETVSAAMQERPQHQELLDQMDAVLLEAFDLLQGEEPDDVPAALRQVQEPKREITTEELADAISYQLELLGLRLPSTASVDHVIVAAEAFLEEANAVTQRIGELEAERDNAWHDALEVRRELADLPEQSDAVAGAADGLEVADEADVDYDDQIAELEAELASCEEDVTDYVDLVEARQALLDAAIQIESVATARLHKLAAELAAEQAGAAGPERAAVIDDLGLGDLDGADLDGADLDGADLDGLADADVTGATIEFYLLARLAALRNVSFAGSVPLLVDDALAGVPPDEVATLLGKLERMSESVQVIYLSDDPAVAAWADEVGFERAAVVPAPAPFR